MPDLRLPVAAVLCGAGLLGASIGGVTSMRDEPLPQQLRSTHVSYHPDCDRHAEREKT